MTEQLAFVRDVSPIVSSTLKVYRDDIEMEKGAILSAARIEKNRALYEKYSEFFSAYPDCFLDMIKPKDSGFHLFEYQRAFLRACMRYRYLYVTAPRAFSKTFICILALLLKCIFQPGSKLFICAPKKEQSAKIAKEKLEEIFQLFPLLKKEVAIENYGKDYVRLVLKNRSVLDVVGALDSTRGGRRHGGLIDEVRDHDGQILNEVVLPLMNVSRRTVRGVINPYEKHQTQFYITSAGTKASWAYEKNIEIFERSIINPQDYWSFGCDYRIPIMHGLLDKSYIDDIKTSATFDEASFARELTKAVLFKFLKMLRNAQGYISYNVI